MDPIIFFILAALAAPLVITAHVNSYRSSILELEGSKPEAQPEESIDDILDRHRQDRRTRRARQKNEWDEKFLLSLPLEEHPDYFELDLKSDDVEEFVQMTVDGAICASYKSRRNSRGVSYSLEIDHITQTASVSTGKISWEVPLSRVDNWKELA
jgi:hypothetical protein